MTDQNKPISHSSAIPQRTGANQPHRPVQQHPSQRMPSQGVRPNGPGNPPVRRMATPQGNTTQQGRSMPLRQGQIPPRSGMHPHPQAQRATAPHQMQQRPVMHHQVPPQQVRQVPQQTQAVTPTQASTQPQSFPEMQLTPLQSFLSNSRNLAFVLMGTIIFGILLVASMFGGSSEPVKSGLQNVVRNQDIRQKLPLCGRVVKGQACVLYIMNATRYDQLAENFFSDALKLTEVPEQKIKWANPKYAKHRIPPGAFAEIFIPSLR